MADIPLALKNLGLPEWLPTPQDVVRECKNHPSHFVICSPDGSDSAFVKYGRAVDMEEARTQNFIATLVNSDDNAVILVPRVYYAFQYERDGYIIMEYIDGSDCDQGDLSVIVSAIRRLRSIPSPTTSPGPVGGGRISHRFFADHLSSVRYNSVNELQDHLNGILARAGYNCEVDFNKEDGGDLTLCLNDIHPGNFRKDTKGRLFALDFAKSNFLPSAFQDITFITGGELARNVAKVLGHNESTHRGTLMLANGRLQLFDNNDYGLPDYLREANASRNLSE